MYSLSARVLFLNNPCASPCRAADDHALIFDEQYYVEAARIILHRHVPQGDPYHGAPAGYDPNAEHPQLAKLVIASGIEIFGDRPLGWRFGSLLAGSVAILAMYALVRAAGGSSWLSLGASSLLAVDNLVLVQGRIATLDIYALAFMLVGTVLYLRRHPVAAGVVLGVGVCTKIVGVYAFLSLALIEVLRFLRDRRQADAPPPRRRADRARTWALCAVVGAVSYLGLLWLLDATVPPFDPGTGLYYSNPIAHTLHMLRYGTALTSPNGPTGIASYPWQWLLDQKPIDYLVTHSRVLGHNHASILRTVVDFRGEMNPFIIFLAPLGFFASAAAIWRSREEVDLVGVGLIVGTYLPFVLLSAILQRTSYIYYMLIVIPGIVLVLARLAARMPRAAIYGWTIGLAYGFVSLYPFRTLSGH